jgi:hypothetical protein
MIVDWMCPDVAPMACRGPLEMRQPWAIRIYGKKKERSMKRNLKRSWGDDDLFFLEFDFTK